jgi:hypothetical protein
LVLRVNHFTVSAWSPIFNMIPWHALESDVWKYSLSIASRLLSVSSDKGIFIFLLPVFMTKKMWFQVGYMLHDRVLRPAEVGVTEGGPTTTEEAAENSEQKSSEV